MTSLTVTQIPKFLELFAEMIKTDLGMLSSQFIKAIFAALIYRTKFPENSMKSFLTTSIYRPIFHQESPRELLQLRSNDL